MIDIVVVVVVFLSLDSQCQSDEGINLVPVVLCMHPSGQVLCGRKKKCINQTVCGLVPFASSKFNTAAIYILNEPY